jgi:mRNA guanylyltransferase
MNVVEKDTPLYNFVLDYIHSVWGSRNRNVFPGPHPVSIERVHIQHIQKNKYMVCEKTDGVRYILACVQLDEKKYAVLVNRAMNMWTIHIAIPKNTILDGELVGTTYLAYDAVCVNGVRTAGLPLDERLEWVNVATRGPPCGTKIRAKEMIPYSDFKNLYERTMNDDSIDGYIFTPIDEPVRMETHETLFKWKPLKHITIDFVVNENKLYIWDNRHGFVFIQNSPVDKPNGTIIECKREPHNGWVFVKERKDKVHANNRRTYIRTLHNIKENIQPNEFSPS